MGDVKFGISLEAGYKFEFNVDDSSNKNVLNLGLGVPIKIGDHFLLMPEFSTKWGWPKSTFTPIENGPFRETIEWIDNEPKFTVLDGPSEHIFKGFLEFQVGATAGYSVTDRGMVSLSLMYGWDIIGAERYVTLPVLVHAEDGTSKEGFFFLEKDVSNHEFLSGEIGYGYRLVESFNDSASLWLFFDLGIKGNLEGDISLTTSLNLASHFYF